MDRRKFLSVQQPIRFVPPQIEVQRTDSGINLYTGPWTDNEISHLLKRLMFGATTADMSYFRTKSLSQAVDELINPTTLPLPPVNDYNSTTVTDPAVAAGQTWVNTPINDGTINSLRISSFKKWWVGVMINQDRSIKEKMTLFWANHFGTETATIGNANWVYGHHSLLRKNATGNFKRLVRAVTTDPGMLKYLNGYLNTASAPDENYARELQELFTVGKDPITNLASFSEDDVKNAAKVLTGWRINNATFNSYFDPTKHDSSKKNFSSFYSNSSIAGKTGTAGDTEIDDLINLLFTKNEVARFICRKIYRWFVYYKIDSTTESNVIQPLADLLILNNYEMKPVLATLFKSEHFFDVQNQGCYIKSPVDHVIGTLRELNVNFPDPLASYSDAYGMWNYIKGWITSMGQDIGDPPNVSGWPSYYQSPQFHELWINSDTLPKRNRFSDTMVSTGYTKNGKKIIIDAVAFAKSLSNPSDPNMLLNDALAVLYRVPLSVATLQTIKQQILLSNQVADHYWTDAWKAYLSNPASQTNFNIVNSRLKNLIQFLLDQSEYQLS